MDALRGSQDQRGFGLVETVIGLSILAFGLLGIGAAFSQGMRSMAGSNYDILAREKAAETIESVFTSRDTKTVSWAEIRNVQGETGSDGGVFLDGEQPLRLAGDDGLLNTEDDAEEIETLTQAGPDGEPGTGDDIVQPLTEFTRQILIIQLGPTLRRLRVVVRYKVGAEARQYEIVTYISSYA